MTIPKRILILASGYSIRQNLWNLPINKIPIWEAIKDEFILSLNWGFKWCNPDIEMFTDAGFYETERENLKKLPIVVGSIKDGHFFKDGAKMVEKNTYLFKSNNKFSSNGWVDGIYSSQLNGIQAITFASLLGCKDIYLLGYDGCGDEQDRTHFYQDDGVTGIFEWSGMIKNGSGKDSRGLYRTDNYNKIKEMNEKYFKPLKQITNVDIYNVSPDSVIDTFPKISYEEFYQRIKNDKPDKQNLNNELNQLLKEKTNV